MPWNIYNTWYLLHNTDLEHFYKKLQRLVLRRKTKMEGEAMKCVEPEHPAHTPAASHPVGWPLHSSTWLARQLGVSIHELPFPQLTIPLKSLMYTKGCWFHRVFPPKGNQNKYERSFILRSTHTTQLCAGLRSSWDSCYIMEVDASPLWLSTWCSTRYSSYLQQPESVPFLLSVMFNAP